MGHATQLAIFAGAAIIVISLGIYGYFVEATVRIRLSVPQVSSVLFAMVSITAIDIFLFRRAVKTGEVRWGKVPAISQYVLIFIAVTFTWLMGLMGYVRSGLRDDGRLGDRAHVLSPDRLRVLDHEPPRPARFPSADQVMRVPLIIRIAALVLATTGFYAYVGQMVPQKEVQPPQEVALRSDLT